MLSLYTEHLSCIGLLPDEDPVPQEEPTQAEETAVTAVEKQAEPVPTTETVEPAAPPEDAVAEKTADPIDDEEDVVKPNFSITELVEEETAEPTKAAEPARAASHFGDLKFGDDYDISADSADDDSGKGFFKRKK